MTGPEPDGLSEQIDFVSLIVITKSMPACQWPEQNLGAIYN